jgi:glycosyltransferase involved in cell wall biosynthesis
MYIGKCLESVINCAYPNDYKEILICDGISTDNTCRIVATYEKKYPFIKLLINAKQTAPYAMNLGIEVSSGDIIVIMGAHTELLPDYIEECIKAFAINPAIGCVGGIVENIPVNSTSEIISKAMSSSFGVGNARFRTGKTGDCYVDTLGPGAYKREVFEKVGLIDVELTRNQDDEFNFRLRKNGYLIYLFGKTVAKYFVRASFSKLYRQYFQYGYWKVYVNKKHKTITTLRQLAPFFFVVFLILGLFASFIHSYIAYTYLSIISIYILSAFFAASAKSGKISSILKIVYTFIILHISYGLGYLEGFIVFFIFKHGPSNRNKKLTR